MHSHRVDEDVLTQLLAEAEATHADYERNLGRRDDEWPRWYARYIVTHLPPEDQVEIAAEPYIAG